MTTFTKAVEHSEKKARRVVVLPPEAFADTWSLRPTTEVAIGLRTIASSDVQAACATASRMAEKWYASRLKAGESTDKEGQINAYNDAVMRHCLARACVDVNDPTVPYFESAEDTIRDALTEDGVKRLWDEYLIMQAETSVAIVRADAGDLQRLAKILLDGRAFAAASVGDQNELRVLLGYASQILVATGQAHEMDIDEADGGYSVRMRRTAA